MIRLILIALMLISLTIPALAKDDRGISIRPVAPTGGEAKGDLWLLAIGIDNYLSWPRLKTAVNDARAVKEVLLKRYYLNQEHVVELTEDKATRHNILAAFRDLAKRVKPEDSLLVYYAGHGHIDPITGKGSWIPVESGTDDPTAWIDNRNITDYLNVNAIKARHILMVSDSCFSGDFFRGNRGANTSTIDDAFLKKAYSRSSRQAISSGGLEPVSDAGFGGNSVFSHFLVAALQNNSKSYLIPSEIFGEIKSGVGRNADQLPQYGDLHNVGGQDGGELILFLKQEGRLQEMGATSAARQKELEHLKKIEQEAVVAKQKEMAEIVKREEELATLDKQIADMKVRLGSGAVHSSDSLDAVVAMVEQKEQQAQKLEELRLQREVEEKKRQMEIERLRLEVQVKRISQLKIDVAKYQRVASSKYGQDMKGTAWDALVATYPESRGVARFDVDAFLSAQGLADDNGNLIPREEKELKQQRDVENPYWEKALATATRAAMQGYIKKFPNGRYVAQARQKDEELQRNPPRPVLPLPLSETVWKTIEDSEYYRNLPLPRAIKVTSNYESEIEYTGSKSSFLPKAVKTETEHIEIAPLGDKCSRIFTDNPVPDYQRYTCGKFLNLGSYHQGKTISFIDRIDKLDGSLFPMKIGAQQSVRVNIVIPANLKYVYNTSSDCRVAEQGAAKDLSPKFTGVAWKVSCQERAEVGDNTTSYEYDDFFLEDLGVFLSSIGTVNGGFNEMKYMLPVPGFITVSESKGDHASRTTRKYSSYDLTVGE